MINLVRCLRLICQEGENGRVIVGSESIKRVVCEKCGEEREVEHEIKWLSNYQPEKPTSLPNGQPRDEKGVWGW